MIQVCYVSRSNKPMSAADLLALLSQCRTNNTEKDVTGMLLYGNGTFLQTLEGEEDVVDELYDRIRQDPRHDEVQLLQRKDIAEREYSEWSMGFDQVSDESLDEVEGLRDFGSVNFNFKTLAGNAEVVHSLLEHYRQPHFDQVLGELEAHDRVIRHLRGSMAKMRDRTALAQLALEGITEASRKGQPSEPLIRLCESALEALKRK